LSPVETETRRYRFGEFVLDLADRQLWRGGERVDLTARYLDALVLFVRNPNQLIEKERFFDEVWDDVVVSDSALTQCIKEIRKQLGDNASTPKFIQTVPRHGYRFVGKVELVSGLGVRPIDEMGAPLSPAVETEKVSVSPSLKTALKLAWLECAAGTIGGGIAGLLGGLFYGLALSSATGEVGTFSTLLVLIALTELVGLLGGFGVSAGLAFGGVLASYIPKMRVSLRISGAAFGGLFMGSLAKLLGIDAFNLLFGQAPAGITGGPEGAFLGASILLGAFLGLRFMGPGKRWAIVVGAGLSGATAGALIPLVGGRLMGGSLLLLTQSFSDSRLHLDQLGSLFGELQFGPATEMASGSLEGMLFGVGLVGALTFLRRSQLFT